MRPYVTYQLTYYLDLQKKQQAAVKHARDINAPCLKKAQRVLAVISERVVSARRNMRHKQIIIDSGILGDMPQTFDSGREVSVCPKCHQRKDVVDMIGIKGDSWVWLKECQQCGFNKKSKATILGRDRIHEEVAKNFPAVDAKMCAFCGETKPLWEFNKIGKNKYDDVPYRHDYICRVCRKNIKVEPDNKGTRKEMPYIYNPQDPTKYMLNPAYFHDREDLLNPDKLVEIREKISQVSNPPKSKE